MRRSLVLSDEAARHPFLASLPPHVRSGIPPRAARAALRITRDDWSSFATAYLACFVAVSIFFA
jgi:hypothetical protein